MSNKVVIIGAGNLAWHLGPNLQGIGLDVEVWTRRPVYEGTKSDWAPINYTSFPPVVERRSYAAVFLAVPDAKIGEVSKGISELFSPQVPIFHTSGATSVDAIDPYFKNTGALWPIRSLRRGEVVASWSDLPLVYFATNPETEARLGRWVKAMSKVTYRLDDRQRAELHLAAVFSNNFTTWLCQIAYDLCEKKGIPYAALVPIIKNTFSELDERPPAEKQTGAAVRRDFPTMERHLALLEDEHQYRELYRMISRLIVEGTEE